MVAAFESRKPPLRLLAKQMADYIYQTKGEGDTIGGVISCVIQGCPIGLGQPVFGKLHAALGNAMLSINAVKGFEYGQGFSHMEMKGSQQNDIFYRDEDKIAFRTNAREVFREVSATARIFISA